jgi:hypothetical protein
LYIAVSNRCNGKNIAVAFLYNASTLKIKKTQANKQTNKHTNTQTNKQTNNDLQHITQKHKDRATRTPLKTGVNSEFVLLVIVLLVIQFF